MGCDYHDPNRGKRDENWRRNNTLINRSGCKRIAGSVGGKLGEYARHCVRPKPLPTLM